MSEGIGTTTWTVALGSHRSEDICTEMRGGLKMCECCTSDVCTAIATYTVLVSNDPESVKSSSCSAVLDLIRLVHKFEHAHLPPYAVLQMSKIRIGCPLVPVALRYSTIKPPGRISSPVVSRRRMLGVEDWRKGWDSSTLQTVYSLAGHVRVADNKDSLGAAVDIHRVCLLE